jgi:hypothetical protein
MNMRPTRRFLMSKKRQIPPGRSARSPFDVPGIDTNVSVEEIVDIVREMRQRAYTPESNARKPRKRANKPHR